MENDETVLLRLEQLEKVDEKGMISVMDDNETDNNENL